MVIAVKSLGNDEWSRPTLRNVKTGHVYADINLGQGVADWHILTTEGEPLYRVGKEVVFEVIEPIGKCFRCNGDAYPSDVEGYKGVCLECDENLLPFEIANAVEVIEDEPDEDQSLAGSTQTCLHCRTPIEWDDTSSKGTIWYCEVEDCEHFICTDCHIEKNGCHPSETDTVDCGSHESKPDEDHITFFTGDGERIDCLTVDRDESDRFVWSLFRERGYSRTPDTRFEREPHTGEC